MGRAVFSGLPMQYLHSVAIQFNPLSPTANKCRHLLPYLTSSSPQVIAQNTTYLPPKDVPPPKGPSPNFNMWIAQTAALPPPTTPEGGNAAGAGGGDSITVTYSDGHVLEVDVKELKHVKEILTKIDAHARTLKARDEAMQG